MARNNGAGQLRRRGSEVVEDIVGIGTVLKDAAVDELHSIKGKASRRLSALKTGAVDLGRDARDAVSRKIERSPWKSVFVAAGLAAGAGLVAAWYLRRR